MKIILANGVELAPIMVTGARKMVQGQSRDTLSFVFGPGIGLDALDAAFTAEACESITIVGDDESEAIHKGYVIRADLKKEKVMTVPATEGSAAVYEDRITVSMRERTYTEAQIAALTDTVDVLVMESLMG